MLKPVYCLVMLFGGPIEVILCYWILYRFIFRLVKPYDVYSYCDVLRDFKINKKGKLLFIGLLGCVYGFNYTYIIRANRGLEGQY